MNCKILLLAAVIAVCLGVLVEPLSAETVAINQIGGFKSPTRIALSDSGVLYVTDHKKGSVKIFDTVDIVTGASNGSISPRESTALETRNSARCRQYRNNKGKCKDQTFNIKDSVAKINGEAINNGVLNNFIAPLGIAFLEVPPSQECIIYRPKKDKCKKWASVPGRKYLFVGDEGDGSVQVFIDGEKDGVLGTGSGEFIMPNAIAVTSDLTVYVVDSKANHVKVYDSSGILQTTFGGSGLDFPTDIALNEAAGELYVSDFYNKRIRVYDLDGSWLYDIEAPPNDQGDPVFYRPAGIGIDPEGNLYVVDNALACVAKISSQGVLLDSIGYRNGAYWTGELAVPVDAAADGTYIYVTSNGQRQLRVFEVVP